MGNCLVPPHRLCAQCRGRAAARGNCCGSEINGILLPTSAGDGPGEEGQCGGWTLQSTAVLISSARASSGFVPTPVLLRAGPKGTKLRGVQPLTHTCSGRREFLRGHSLGSSQEVFYLGGLFVVPHSGFKTQASDETKADGVVRNVDPF